MLTNILRTSQTTSGETNPNRELKPQIIPENQTAAFLRQQKDPTARKQTFQLLGSAYGNKYSSTLISQLKAKSPTVMSEATATQADLETAKKLEAEVSLGLANIGSTLQSNPKLQASCQVQFSTLSAKHADYKSKLNGANPQVSDLIKKFETLKKDILQLEQEANGVGQVIILDKELGDAIAKLTKSLNSRPPIKKAAEDSLKAVQEKRLAIADKLNKPDARKATKTYLAELTAAKASVEQLVNDVKKLDKKGSNSSPFDINWPKPAASDYATLYLGGKAKVTPEYTQEKLKAMVGQEYPQNSGVMVKAYKPTELNALPGGEPIGIAAEHQTSIGKKIGPAAGDDPIRSESAKLGTILKAYGYSWANEPDQPEMDHVIELQLSGKDTRSNLWPLARVINGTAGATIAGMSFGATGTKLKVKMEDLKADSSRKYFFKIKTVKNA